MDQQQKAFLLQVSRQLETVLAACKQNGSAEVLIGSKRRADKLLQVKLVAEEKMLTAQNNKTQGNTAQDYTAQTTN